ncbi:MAG: glycosyltransferase, partial [Scytonema sp. PMC 1070.18]|nr:glycosyltransferase [Scytonema sp. PMC 1070.18]
MKLFEHLIITRFNVTVDFSKPRVGIDSEWLTHRFRLFENFCYPSIHAQSNQNFKWLIYFDQETPEYFKNKIKEYAEWSNFIPIYIKNRFTNEINRENVLNYLNGVEYLITTRLDNDDAVSKDFIQEIQNKFQKQEFEFMNFTNGYVWSNNK